MLWVKLPFVETIYPQSKKKKTVGVKITAGQIIYNINSNQFNDNDYTVHTSPTHIGSNVGNLYTAKLLGFWPLVANNVPAGLIFILCIPQLDSGNSLLGLPSKTGMDKLLSDNMSSTRSYKENWPIFSTNELNRMCAESICFREDILYMDSVSVIWWET